MVRFGKSVSKVGRFIPKPLRARAKRAGKTVLKRMPDGLETKVRTAFGRKGIPKKLLPADPLGLEVAPNAGASARPVIGRAAGAGGPGSGGDASERLYRAMHGTRTPLRPGGGGRPIGGVFGADLRAALEGEGHEAVPFVPGTTAAIASRVEVVVIDLQGFSGVWSGALDATGIGLFREVLEGIATAQGRGATCWIAVRGDDLHRLGAIQLRRMQGVEVLHAGASRPALHYTEDPGDAPSGVADIIRRLECSEVSG